MTQWFTSDLHLAHPHVAKLRGFEDYREHDETIIRNLNERVAPDDDLYVLGDISSGSKTSLDFRNLLLHGHTHAATPYEFKTALLRQKVSPDYTAMIYALTSVRFCPYIL